MEGESAKRYHSCKEIFAELSAYLDVELPADACREIEEHLAGCSPCVDFVSSLRKTVELCRRYEPGALPEPLTRRVREQLLSAYNGVLAARKGPPGAA
jgi:anti-sigma factor (TIGR02949 family)